MYVTTIGIDGMRCGQCESHVQELLSAIEGALWVKASHLKDQAEIHSPVEISQEQVQKALEGSGYRVLSFTSETKPSEGFFYKKKEARYLKRRS